MAELTVAAGLARGLMEFAAAKGADRTALAEASGIAPTDLEDQDARIPISRYVALMRSAKELTNDPALALHFGGSVDMSEFSVVGLLFHACETIVDGIAQVNRYGQLVVEVDTGGEERCQFRRRNGQLWLVDVRRNANDFPELTEATFARFIGMTRHFGESPLVAAVHVTHAEPAHAAEYDRVFGAPTTFATEWNAMRLDERSLRNPRRLEPAYVFGILHDHAEGLLGRMRDASSFRARVEQALVPLLHTGECDMRRVARSLGCSRDTLYRGLRAEGATFAQIVDEMRHQLALHYLGTRRVSVKEAAYLVGFADPAAFSRAFKRWTGSAPRAARQQGGTAGQAQARRRDGERG